MTLSIENGGYPFLIRLASMPSISLWKEFQLLRETNTSRKAMERLKDARILGC